MESSLSGRRSPRSVASLLRAAHLEPSVAVTLAASGLALTAGHRSKAVLIALATLAGQLSIGWGNDWIDRDRDRASARRDKPIVAGEVAARSVLRAALVAAAVCALLSLLAGLAAGLVNLVAVGSGWLYNAVAKPRLWSVLPWAVAFGLLPAFVTRALPGAPWPAWWGMAAGALLGAGAHFANALPDLEADRLVAVQGLPHRLGARGSLLATAGLVGAGVIVVTLGPGLRPLSVAVGATGALLLVAALATAASGRRRSAFRLVMLVLLLLATGLTVQGAALV